MARNYAGNVEMFCEDDREGAGFMIARMQGCVKTHDVFRIKTDGDLVAVHALLGLLMARKGLEPLPSPRFVTDGNT